MFLLEAEFKILVFIFPLCCRESLLCQTQLVVLGGRVDDPFPKKRRIVEYSRCEVESLTEVSKNSAVAFDSFLTNYFFKMYKLLPCFLLRLPNYYCSLLIKSKSGRG